jgi:DNA-binding MarR family transcriptional regulator
MGSLAAARTTASRRDGARTGDSRPAVPESKASRFDSPEQEVFLNLWRTYDRLRSLEDDLFRQFDLTPQQYNALRLLRAARPEPMPTLVLADRLVSRAPDITRMLDKLEQAGLVERIRPAENRRQVLVSISDAGVALLDEMAEPIRTCHRGQLGHLSKTDLKQLAALLKKARQPHESSNSCWL